jgi:hypothetical protein
MFTLTANDIDAVATFMQAGAAKHWRTYLKDADRPRVRFIARCCDAAITPDWRVCGPAQLEADLKDEVLKAQFVKDRCGSIWIMLLGSLLINLFVRWLFSKEQP